MFFKNKIEIKDDLVPKHVAFIMDGNGRWAKKRGLPRLVGHNAGTETIKKIVKSSRNLGIGYITFYAFSTENWKRPNDEVTGLMKLLVKFVHSEIEEIHQNNIRVNVFGDIEGLPEYARVEVIEAIEKTKYNDGMQFNLALNYGGRDEIIHAVRLMMADYADQKIQLDNVNESLFSEYLYTKGMPDPDLLIRTSGEQRLSNFLLWQLAYTEFIFEPLFWPDFNEEAYKKAIHLYQERNRRFGAL
ncbi:MAG: isoprenyl transferase [Clostridia bacterium]|nr:isoprenyl transferase [Clostridia bacterium]